ASSVATLFLNSVQTFPCTAHHAATGEGVLGEGEQPAEHTGHRERPLAELAEEPPTGHADTRGRRFRQAADLLKHDPPPLPEKRERTSHATPASAPTVSTCASSRAM